ncbi:hypothetical protein [uncultured Alistipes sp.]|uniref:hypothetical protein n=1 Tax=uncultured Alistipes sp. TaxID=538949 RepID=UPI00263379B9|nr:hypothetical protein [uncultured Alistipes sp.]
MMSKVMIGHSDFQAKIRISRVKNASSLAFFPRRSIFGAAKDTNKRGQKQACLHFAEREYLGRSQRYEKSSAETNCELKMESGKLKMRGAGRSRRSGGA